MQAGETHDKKLASSVPVRRPWRRWIVACTVVAGFLMAGLGWVVASPLGGSPDEDFHMGSIWCPRPATESCETEKVGDRPAILVPESVVDAASCHAFKGNTSAQCTLSLSDERIAKGLRYDDDSYPTGYYRFQHFFIGSDVGTSVLTMRAINTLIALVLLTSTFFVMPRRYRQAYSLAMLVSWIPMGWYFINSLNPSSWAITGTFVYGTALFASLQRRDKYQWFGLLIASLGAVLCISSRGDAAFYIFVVSLSLLFAVEKERWTWFHRIFAVLWSLVGIYFMASSGQAETVATVEPSPRGSVLSVIIHAIMQIPRFAAGLFGHGRGPGWFDTNIDGLATFLAMGVAVVIIVRMARQGTARTGLASLMLLGAIFGVPFVTTVMGLQNELRGYQPRYMLPLVAMFFFVLLAVRKTSEVSFTRRHICLIVTCEMVAHALVLKRLLWRYVSGMKGIEPWNLDEDIKWWWDVPITPMMVWIGASVALTVAVFGLFYLARDESLEGRIKANI